MIKSNSAIHPVAIRTCSITFIIKEIDLTDCVYIGTA
jgi:hypothetical protein